MQRFSLLLLLTLLLVACENVETEAKYPTGQARERGAQNDIYDNQGSIFGSASIFGANKKAQENAGPGIAVNSFLWRAALDTVSFMPLASADPFGGTILTDWYSPADTPNERFKTNVFILTKALRSDGIRVRVFKQKLDGGTWKDADVSGETARKLEDAILSRARQLRVSQASEE